MAGPASYARLVPKIRVMKSQLLTQDRYREMMASSELKDALSQLRDSLYSEAADAANLEVAIRILETLYFKYLDKLARESPEEVLRVINAFRMDYELRDVLSAMQRVAIGSPGFMEYPTYYIDGSILKMLSQDPEAQTSVTRFLDAIQGTWAYTYADMAVQLYNETKNPQLISWIHLPASIELYSSVLEELRDPALQGILCPLIEYKISASLIQAKLSEIESRIITRLISRVKSCGVDASLLRQMYEREATPQDLASSLREALKYVRPEGEDLGAILHSARMSLKAALKRGVERAFQGYPFSPAIAAAGAVMLRFEVENIIAILSSIELKLKVDEYSKILIISR
ncbi:MAG: V-type ATPase subunit [Desulfurococcales archaeon]|nr:V-type ATPase subunit [Desulfurococcales archaeon]